MAHERIHKFNTRDTYPDQDLDNDLCQVVRAGNMIFLRGQVGTDFAGKLVGGNDPAKQTEQAMANVKTLLDDAGSQLDHVCKITIYITNPANRAAVYRVVGKWLKGVFPVSTGVVVSALAKPEWLMEIDVIAVLPDTK
jgi:enamine deaminase RidA (YjgF/YER057c/UK114 family)